MRTYRDARGGRWTNRARWYEGPDGGNLRLQFETQDGVRNVYPANRVEAEQLWQRFKEDHPFNTKARPWKY